MKYPTCVAFAVAIVMFSPSHAHACKVAHLAGPTELVAGADTIVVAFARKFTRMTPDRIPDHQWHIPNTFDGVFEFHVLDTLKGELKPAATIRIPGRLSNVDDFNDAPPTASDIRPAGRSGECFAYTHRLNARYLLFLKRRGSSLSPYWAPLARVNEQLRPGVDPWLVWTRGQLRPAEAQVPKRPRR